jgi:hypothetical protein
VVDTSPDKATTYILIYRKVQAILAIVRSLPRHVQEEQNISSLDNQEVTQKRYLEFGRPRVYYNEKGITYAFLRFEKESNQIYPDYFA